LGGGRGEEYEIIIDGEPGEVMERVAELCDLSSLTSDDAKCHKEITKRIANEKEAFIKKGRQMTLR